MTKTATIKRKPVKTSAIRNRLLAAICMLLISSIMLVSSTYAWFTLSTAPEVKGMETSVAGNGSLEVALMPGDGLLGSIQTGRSGMNGGGTVAVPTANTTWGNLITLSDTSYGLQTLELKPLSAAKLANGAEAEMNFGTPVFGYDGRIESLDTTNVGLFTFNTEANKFNTANSYGVRAIVNGDTTYGYIIDLAFRMNVAGKLMLQQTGIQRVYNSTTDANSLSDKGPTQGKGSYMQIPNTSLLGSAIRLAFIQNYGNGAANATTSVLAYGKIGNGGTIELYKYVNGAETALEDEEENVLLAMEKNTPYQVSVAVWIDGTNVTNRNFSATELASVILNLQFATDAALNPAINAELRDNPPAANMTKAQITEKLTGMATALAAINAKDASERTAAESALLAAATAAGLVVANANATQAEINEAYTNLEAAYTAANP